MDDLNPGDRTLMVGVTNDKIGFHSYTLKEPSFDRLENNQDVKDQQY